MGHNVTEMQSAEDHVVPSEKWEFDADVAQCFDNMLCRSIPEYETMRDLCFRLGSRFVQEGTCVIDLGASRGEALRPFIEQNKAASYFALEISEPMRSTMTELYEDRHNVFVTDYDLRKIRAKDFERVSLVLSILTIQFTPIEYRQRIVSAVYEMLEPGGAFIFVEKILGANSRMNDLLVEEYYEMKHRNGYSYEDIERKKAALEGVLVPVTATWNEDLLRTAGFTNYDCFYRHLNFAGWVAIK